MLMFLWVTCINRVTYDWTDPQARLANEYVRLLEHSTRIHYAFAPAHHVTQSPTSAAPHRFVYMVNSRDVSYSDIHFSLPFGPIVPESKGSDVTNSAFICNVTLTLPQSYMRQWTKQRLLNPLRPGSLAMLQHAGPYNKSLAYVIGTSLDPCNEWALVALVLRLLPKELVPSSLELGRPPPCKKKKCHLASTVQTHTSKGKHRAGPLPWSGLLPANQLESVITFWSLDGDLGQFFTDRFKPATLWTYDQHGKSIQTTVPMDFNHFEWSVRQARPEPWDLPEDRQLPPTDKEHSRKYSAYNTVQQLPIQQYKGHYYYCSMRLIPIYWRRELDRSHTFDTQEILPFMESWIYPGFFDPLFSYLHWKIGDKVVEKNQDHLSCFYVIKEVQIQDHTFIGALVTLPELKESLPLVTLSELEGIHLPKDPLDAHKFKLMLHWSDHVRVIAGVHKNTKGTILDIEDDSATIKPYDSHSQVGHSPLVSALSIWQNSSDCSTSVLATNWQWAWQESFRAFDYPALLLSPAQFIATSIIQCAFDLSWQRGFGYWWPSWGCERNCPFSAGWPHLHQNQRWL